MRKSVFFKLFTFRLINEVNAPPLLALDDVFGNGDGLCRSSSSVEFACKGEPVTEMLSFSKPSSTLFKLLSFSSVGGGVNCDEFVNEMFVGDVFGLVVLCGLLHSVF